MSRSITFAVLGLFSVVAHAQSGLDAPSPVGAYLNGVFPTTTPGGASAGSGGFTQENYFPGVTFVEPLRVIEHPAADELIIIGKDAIGHRITHARGATDKRQFFDLRPIVHINAGTGEGSISDFAFHPEFGQAGSPSASYVYIAYWWSPENSGTVSDDNGIDGYNRVSRFEVVNERVDLSTELVMINQYDREFWHSGIALEFGADGFLYISMGDETPTTCCNRADSTQRLDGGLWSGILRIDVDNDPSRSHAIRRQPTHPTADPSDNGPGWPDSFTQGYSIPNDNPFLAPDGSALEEFYSLGLRHPWTMNIDQQTGDIWVGDVGRFRREEVNRIRAGENHEWPFQEGSIRGPDAAPASIIGQRTGPQYDYTHDEGKSVILGGLYRGSRHPDLTGKVLFSDFTGGQLWAGTPGANGLDVEQIATISSGFANGVVGYLFDSRGDILMVHRSSTLRDGATIDFLGREQPGAPTAGAPAFLSQTGAFTDLLTRTTIPGCVSYEENMPFWSDSALKSRWLCLPNDGTHDTPAEQIVYSENDPWEFPVGTVFIKHFDMEAEEGNPQSAFPLETRFFVVGTDGYYGLSYRWNEAGTNATLVDAGGDVRMFDQLSLNGTNEPRIWEYPSRGECLECHSRSAGSALGVNTRQLNGDHTYQSSGLTGNQVETFAALNMFSTAVDVGSLPNVVTAVGLDDTSASLEDRARSYLDANCGYCHLPDNVRANFDARLTTPLAEQELVNGALIESAGVDGEAAIVPGDPARSIVHVRIGELGSRAMPPLAKNRVDEAGLALMEEWIVSLGDGSTPTPTDDSTGGGTGGGSGSGSGGGGGGGPISWILLSGLVGLGIARELGRRRA